MRIVGGRWRGRRIEAPAGSRVRPTADRVREAWLSIVQLEVADARVLDLFAGSGALGLEALSRGARVVEFVDSHPASLQALRANIARLDAGAQVVVHRADVFDYLRTVPATGFDLAFADPPYGRDLAAAVVRRWLEAPFARTLGVEHARDETMPAGADTRRYGDTALSFYRHSDP